jgi:hypothetical protein
MVGNGSHIHCSGFCPNVPITLQNTPFHIPIYLFPVEGAYVVLGMEWLKTLGKIDADFTIPSISFAQQNIVVPSKETVTANHHHPHYTTYTTYSVPIL